MYRPPRPSSTTAGVQECPFPQFVLGREEAVGDVEESRRRRSPTDLLNGEQFHGDGYIGELVDPLVNNFVFVHSAML
jgi:hypothetical protein